jgi:hypothetical protein
MSLAELKRFVGGTYSPTATQLNQLASAMGMTPPFTLLGDTECC